MLRRVTLFSAVAWALCLGASVAGDTGIAASIFQENMVLQRDVPVPVWGWAEPGVSIRLSPLHEACTDVSMALHVLHLLPSTRMVHVPFVAGLVAFSTTRRRLAPHALHSHASSNLMVSISTARFDGS